jgi:hypothetical protein
MKKLENLIEIGIDKDITERLDKKYKNDVLEIGKEIEQIKEEENKRNFKDSVEGYLELMKLDLDNDYKITRDRNRVKFIDKYVDSIVIERVGGKKYNILLNMYLNNLGKYENEYIEVSEKGYFYILKIKSTKLHGV